MSGAVATGPIGANRTSAPELAPAMQRAVWALVALLVAKRLAYHLSYIVDTPFALGTFSESRRYELAARDILAHPPLGSLPFEVNGLYSFLLALPMSIVPEVVVALVLQLVVAAGALLLFQRGARRVFGSLFGGLSLCVLLASPELAFYENKYLPVAFGAALQVLALIVALRAFDRQRPQDVALAGATAGLSALAAPALALSLPASLLGFVVLARSAGKPSWSAIGPFVLGALVALAPMALRNQLVTGSPDVLSRRNLALALFVGHNAFADGRWNTGGGVLSSVEAPETRALAEKLRVTGEPERLAAEVDRELIDRAVAFAKADPLAFLGRTVDKLWSSAGNQRFLRDYDLAGEEELIGAFHQWGLPFGVVLGLGVLGLCALARRARAVRHERARLLSLLLVLGGQLGSVLMANALLFSSAEMRAGLLVPLAFTAGPGLEALYARLSSRFEAWPKVPARLEVGTLVLIASALICAQAFWPRVASFGRTSAAHYHNLGVVEESLGRLDAARKHYAKARERNPRQAVFFLAEGRVLRQLGYFEQAMNQLTHIIRMPNTSKEVHAQAHAERMLAAAREKGPAPDVLRDSRGM